LIDQDIELIGVVVSGRLCIGVDLSQILRAIPNLGENVVKTDKCMGVSQLLGGARPGCPKVYAYAFMSREHL